MPPAGVCLCVVLHTCMPARCSIECCSCCGWPGAAAMLGQSRGAAPCPADACSPTCMPPLSGSSCRAPPSHLSPAHNPLLSTPSAVAGRAPMFFKKAVDDATSEWAQHHAKRFIDTKAKVRSGGGGQRVAVPTLHVSVCCVCCCVWCMRCAGCWRCVWEHRVCVQRPAWAQRWLVAARRSGGASTASRFSLFATELCVLGGLSAA